MNNIVNIKFGSRSDYRFALNIYLFDANNEQVWKKFTADKIESVELPTGIYNVRLELNGLIKDELVRFHKDEHIVFRVPPEGLEWNDARVLDLPQIYSSIPFDDERYKTYKSTYNYYKTACINWSSKSTSKQTEETHSSSVFVFFRFPNRSKFKAYDAVWSSDLSHYFSLCDENCNVIYYLNKQNSIINLVSGYLAFNIAVVPGTYYIKSVKDDVTDLIPLQVFKNFHTQVFMMLGANPLFGTLRIILSRERKFDPQNTLNKYIDILSDKIRSKDAQISNELIRFVGNYKMESPMLAILCIHAYMNSDSDVSNVAIGRMIDVLNEFILRNNAETPDIKAILLLAERYLGQTMTEKKPTYSVPMLRLSVAAISEAAMTFPSLIESHSMIDYAIENLNQNSVFTVFRWKETNKLHAVSGSGETATLPSFSIIQSQGKNQKKTITAEAILSASDKLLKTTDDSSANRTISEILISLLTRGLKKIITRSPESQDAITASTEILESIVNDEKSSATALYIADYLKANPTMDITAVSNNLNIPLPIIERLLEVKRYAEGNQKNENSYDNILNIENVINNKLNNKTGIPDFSLRQYYDSNNWKVLVEILINKIKNGEIDEDKFKLISYVFTGLESIKTEELTNLLNEYDVAVCIGEFLFKDHNNTYRRWQLCYDREERYVLITDNKDVPSNRR